MTEEKNTINDDLSVVMVKEEQKINEVVQIEQQEKVEEEKHEMPADVGEKNVDEIKTEPGDVEKKAEVKTKQTYRERIWIRMAKEKLTTSYRSLCGRIPLFKNYNEATKRLTDLDVYRQSDLLMISPDKPQESVIIASLLDNKEVLIPRPRLLSGLFYRVKKVNDSSVEEETKNAVVRHDIKQIQTPVNFNTKDLKVDMLVVGSVCVNRAGYRIGAGEGFVDLEYAILSKMKAVDENVVIVTTVHDCQIVDDLPNEIFESHDVPVDIIVTPTQTIVVNEKLRRPNEIIWSKISKKRISQIPILEEIKELEEKEGKSLTLKEDDSDLESRLQERIRIKKFIIKLRTRTRRMRSSSKEDDKNKENKRRSFFLKRRRVRKSKDKTENNDTDKQTDAENPPAKKAISKPLRASSNYTRQQIDFSLRLSNIASDVRVRDLKSALLERGVKPINITWRGQRGFCYLHFGKVRKSKSPEIQPIQLDSVVANLQKLKIGESAPNADMFITVEPAKPISRITHVSAM